MTKEEESASSLGVENEGRWPASASVGMLLTYKKYNLIMVRQRNIPESGHQVWGIPAGGIGSGELLGEGILRELHEETGIKSESIKFLNSNPYPLCLPGENKSGAGYIFDAEYIGDELPYNGWEMEDEGVDMARPQSVVSVTNIIRSDLVYRPEINIPQMMRWLMRIYNRRGYDYDRDVHKYLDGWLREKRTLDKIDGLRISEYFVDRGEPVYKPPYQDW